MANIQVTDVQKALGGLDYPATKEQVLDHARGNGSEEVVDLLEADLSDREYDGPNGVMKELKGDLGGPADG